jgi:uncharacterized protein (TIGR02145 family)
MKILLFLSLIFALISCSEDTTGPNDSSKLILEKTISPSEVQQIFETGKGLRIVVPAGSLSEKFGLKITRVDRPEYNNEDDLVLGNNVFQLTVTGDYKAITPVEIRIKYDKSLIKSGMNATQSVRGLVYRNNDFLKLENIIDLINEEIVFYMIPKISSKTKNEEHTLGNDDAIIGDAYKNTLQILTSETIKIGNQIWMKKNLDVAYYRNGDEIRQIEDNTEWVNANYGAWSYYNNDPALGAIYGKIYNWFAINDPRGLAPEGWHVASTEDYIELVKSLKDPDNGALEIKEKGTSHWLPPNTGATNSSGMTMLPGGYRSYYGKFYEIGLKGVWWTSNMNEPNADYILIRNDTSYIDFRYGVGWAGASVRCVKD